MKIPVGLDKYSGEIALIDDLPKEKRGLKCNCICPECKSDLIARMGEKTVRHFAHYKGNEKKSCQETALHLLGKYVLSKLNRISLCPYKLSCNGQWDILGRHYNSKEISLFESKKALINSSEIEKTIGDIRSDVFSKVNYGGANLEINFEIKVWHEIDEKKYQKIKKLNLTTVEIDLVHLLFEKNVDFNLVKNEIKKSQNQTIIYIENEFLEPYVSELETELQLKIDTINNKISDWSSNVNKKYVKEGLKLPDFRYNLENIPNKRIHKAVQNKLPTAPNIAKWLPIKSFKHVRKHEFEFVCLFGNQEKKLPVLIDLDRFSLSFKCNFNKPSYLIFDEDCLAKPCEELSFEWGKNEIASQYQNEYNQVVNIEKNKHEFMDIEIVRKNISIIDDLLLSGQVLRSNNYQAIRVKANLYYKELVSKGLEAEFLAPLIEEELDPHKIYGCESKYWQLCAIRDMCWVNNDTIDVKFLSSRLSKLGIDLVGPYKELLYRSKVMERNNIEMPFLTPYQMLYAFLNHLTTLGFLARGYGGRFKKNLPFGEFYKTMKLVKV